MNGAAAIGLVALLAGGVLAVAGCADPEAPAETPLGLDDVQADTTPTTGAIKGVVVDEAIRPIAGANLTVMPGELRATTDEDGQFVVEGLAPGVYFVSAEAFGYGMAQSSVDVVADAAASLRLLLQAVFVPRAYHDVYHYEGFMTAYVSIASFAAELVAPGATGCTCTWILEPPQEGLEYFIYEADGQAAAENPAPVYGTVYWEFISEPDHAIHSSHGHFPIYERFERSDFVDETVNWTVRLTGSQWVHVNTSFDVYVSAWYNSVPPEDWSFVGGDT